MDSESEAVSLPVLRPRVSDNKTYQIEPLFSGGGSGDDQAMENRFDTDCRELQTQRTWGEDVERRVDSDRLLCRTEGAEAGGTCGCPGSGDQFGIYQESCTRTCSVTLLCQCLLL